MDIALRSGCRRHRAVRAALWQTRVSLSARHGAGELVEKSGLVSCAGCCGARPAGFADGSDGARWPGPLGRNPVQTCLRATVSGGLNRSAPRLRSVSYRLGGAVVSPIQTTSIPVRKGVLGVARQGTFERAK